MTRKTGRQQTRIERRAAWPRTTIMRHERFRRLCTEALENRAMLSGTPTVGVIGDSLSSEYQYSSAPFARNWIEQFAASGNVDFGPIGSYGTPRGQGYAYNWALGGSTSATIFTDGQVSGLTAQIPVAGINYAVLEIGSDDIGPGGAAFNGIYNGTWTQAQITAKVNATVTNVKTAIDDLLATGVKVVVATAADHSTVPGVFAMYPNAAQRQLVANVVHQESLGIIADAQADHVVVADLGALQTAAGGTDINPKTSLVIGNVSIDLTQTTTSTPSNAAWIFGGTHPNSALQGVMANMFAQALDEGYNAGIPLFTEQQILATQGLSYGGSDTLAGQIGPYENYVLNYASPASTVVARNLFYNHSTRYDTTGNPQTPLPFSDDNAIATNKSAYLPNGTAATLVNVSSYDRGINGIMIDLSSGGSHGSITETNILNDFTFKVGNNNSPNLWGAALNPTSVTVRTGAGLAGTDRVELIWPDNAIQQQWLEVTVKATADTGLATNDVFFFGNEIGATGASNTATIAKVSSSDVTDTQTHGATLKANIPVTNIYDFNKDGQVGAADVTDAQTHGTTNKTGLNFINIGAGGPFAPEVVPNAPTAAGNDSLIASAVATTSSSLSATPQPIPPWIVNRLAQLEPKGGSVATFLEHLAHENAAKTKSVLVEADQVANAVILDDAHVDSLLVKLGLE